jgi:hypothetical protein
MRRLAPVFLILGLVMAGCGGSSSAGHLSRATSSSKVAIGGQVTAVDVDAYLHNCKQRFRSANDDVGNGSQVTIYNAAGTIVGTTMLSNALITGTSLTTEGCQYTWDASVAPSTFYSVQVGSHNKVTFSRAAAAADTANLSVQAN